MHFKNTDGRWGAGEGTLDSIAVDENFYEVDQRLNALEATPPEAISVDHVTSDGTTFSVVLTDGYAFGPFTLPTAKFTVLGEWQPSTLYPANVFISEGGNSYLVQYPHTSGLTFDPGANDGMGHNYYGLLPFPNAPVIEWLDAGWTANTAIEAWKVFSIPDVGVFLTLHEFDSGPTFDPDLVDGSDRPVYQKLFAAIESNKQRVQFQYPGTPPTDSSVILCYVQDDDRDLLFPSGWTGSFAHLLVACTETIEWVISFNAEEIGRVTFNPGELDDGDGGQYGEVTGAGATLASSELLKVFAPGYADVTAKFLTLSLSGTYQDAS